MAGPLDSLSGVASAPELAPAAAVILGQVFAWSGTAKWARPRETAQALVGFRLVRVPTRRAARAIAGAEIGLAALLLFSPLIAVPLMTAALVLAAIMSIGFVATIALALRRPERFPCMCFGATDAPLSAVTLVRALVLLIASVVATASAAAVAELPGAQDWVLWNVVGAGALSCMAIASRLPELLRFDDPFDFSDQVMLDPTGFGPITHDHD